MPPAVSAKPVLFKTSSQIRVVRLTLAALLCVFSVGCAVPLRAPTKTRSVSGEKAGKKIDLDFIKVGVTGREEVVQKLGWIDTGVKNDRFFLGRWASSSWGVLWAAGGEYAAAGGWNRSWSVHNLLLDFDEKGVVRHVSYVRDKDLLEALSTRAAQDWSGSLNLSTPIEVPVAYVCCGKQFPGTLTLGRDAFQFLLDRETGANELYDFKTSPENISQLSVAGPLARDPRPAERWTPHPERLLMTIHFKRKTPVGQKMSVQVDIPAMMTLIKYIAQTRPGS